MSEKMRIFNLTQHEATPSQIRDGVYEPSPEVKERIRRLLTFEEPPSTAMIKARAEELAGIAAAHKARYAMIGGASYLMSALERALIRQGIIPLHAFSKRVVEEVMDPETGEVRKVQVFKHLAFVLPPRD